MYVEERFKKNTTAFLPERKTQKSAGYDFKAPYDFTLKPKEKRLIWTDVKATMEDNEFLMIQVRSSLGVKYDVILANSAGIIDADYFSNIGNDGNIGLCLKNNGVEEVVIIAGEGIAQGIFIQYLTSENCNSNDERSGGIGSTNS